MTTRRFNCLHFVVAGLVTVLGIAASSNAQCLVRTFESGLIDQDQFGEGISLSATAMAVGSPLDDTGGENFGAVYIYAGEAFKPWEWTLRAIVTSDFVTSQSLFGSTVVLEGDLLVVGAPLDDVTGNNKEGAIHVFRAQNSDLTSWIQVDEVISPNPVANDKLGSVIALHDGEIVAGVPAHGDDGIAYVFNRIQPGIDDWEHAQTIGPGSIDEGAFGTSVSMSGDTLVIGAPVHRVDGIFGNAGVALVYQRDTDTGQWESNGLLKASPVRTNDRFGSAVSTDGSQIAVGAPNANAGGVTRAGSVFFFTREEPGGAWQTDTPFRLDNPDPDVDDNFGESIALQGLRAVIGMPDGGQGVQQTGGIYPAAGTETGLWQTDELLTVDGAMQGDQVGAVVDIQMPILLTGVPSRCLGKNDCGYGAAFAFLFPETDVDCNGNLQNDICDIAFGTNGAEDCDDDLIPDSCQNPNIAVWAGGFKGIYTDPDNWCSLVPASDRQIIFNTPAPDDNDIEVVFLDDEQAVGLIVNAGDPVLLMPFGTSYQLLDSGSVLDGDLLRLGTRAGVSSLTVDRSMLLVGEEITAPGSVRIADHEHTDALFRVTGQAASVLVTDDIVVGPVGTGRLRVEDQGLISSSTLTIGSRVMATGHGHVEVTGSNSLLDVTGTITVERGRMELSNGSLTVFNQLNIERAGFVMASAPMQGNVENLGLLATLASPHDIEIRGRYQQLEDEEPFNRIGRLLLRMVDGIDQVQIDSLQVRRSVDLGGALIVTAPPGINPTLGASYDIVVANTSDGPHTLSGRFSVASFPGLPNGKYFKLEYPSAEPKAQLTVETLDSNRDSKLGDDQPYGFEGLVQDAALANVFGEIDGLFLDLVLVVDGPNEGDPGSIEIFRNNGDTNENQFGEQISIPIAPNPNAVAIADFDGDGINDIVVAHEQDGSLHVILNRGLDVDPTFFQRRVLAGVLVQPDDLLAHDFDEDGRPDIVLLGTNESEQAQAVTLLNQGGTGDEWNELSVDQVLGLGGGGFVVAAIGDLDNDKSIPSDIAALRDPTAGGQVVVLGNLGHDFGGDWNGFGLFTEVETGLIPVWMDIGDLDNDKELDLFLVGRDLNDNGAFSVILQEEEAQYGAPNVVPFAGIPGPVVLSPFDPDDDLDVAVVLDLPSGDQIIQVLRNDSEEMGQLVFSADDQFEPTGIARMLLAGSLNADIGDDLVVISDTGTGGFPIGRGGASVAQFVPTERVCRADVNDDGILDFFDVLFFLTAFSSQAPSGDWNEDEIWDFFDILAYLNVYSTGCA